MEVQYDTAVYYGESRMVIIFPGKVQRMEKTKNYLALAFLVFVLFLLLFLFCFRFRFRFRFRCRFRVIFCVPIHTAVVELLYTSVYQ